MVEQKESEDSDECFIFCKKHDQIGKRELKSGGKNRLQQKLIPPKSSSNQKKSPAQKGSKKIPQEDEDDNDEEATHEVEEDDQNDEADDDFQSRKKNGARVNRGAVANKNHIMPKKQNQAAKNGFKNTASPACKGRSSLRNGIPQTPLA